mgnify:CR=1 FL=1
MQTMRGGENEMTRLVRSFGRSLDDSLADERGSD